MNIKTGVDLVEIKRVDRVFKRHGERFLQRIYTPNEIEQSKRNPPELAVRFAAKEAASKALGTGIGIISWKDVEVYSHPSGEPHLRLHGSALNISRARGITNWSVSLSHSREMAVAVVVGYGE